MRVFSLASLMLAHKVFFQIFELVTTVLKLEVFRNARISLFAAETRGGLAVLGRTPLAAIPTPPFTPRDTLYFPPVATPLCSVSLTLRLPG